MYKEWISVEDRTPTKWTKVLLVYGEHVIMGSWIGGVNGYFMIKASYVTQAMLNSITHWAELPELPLKGE